MGVGVSVGVPVGGEDLVRLVIDLLLKGAMVSVVLGQRGAEGWKRGWERGGREEWNGEPGRGTGRRGTKGEGRGKGGGIPATKLN